MSDVIRNVSLAGNLVVLLLLMGHQDMLYEAAGSCKSYPALQCFYSEERLDMHILPLQKDTHYNYIYSAINAREKVIVKVFYHVLKPRVKCYFKAIKTNSLTVNSENLVGQTLWQISTASTSV